jgi:predicted small lipoprotein YifL
MKTTLYALVICGGLIAAGCGQKGALYLPDKNAAVVTRPAASSTTAPEQAPPNTTPAPALPSPDQGSSQQTPQNRAPEPPPSPTSEGTAPKTPQDKDKDKSNAKSSPTPPN